MDQNTNLILSKMAKQTRWEDEEKSTNDVDQLREEFRQRLYLTGQLPPLATDNQNSFPTKSK